MTSPPPNEANGVRAGKENWRFLKVVKSQNLDNWDYTSQFHRIALSGRFPIIKLGEVLSYRKGQIVIEDDKIYKRCRVQLYGKGIVLRDEVKGKEIKVKKQQVCKIEDFLVAEIDAKFGGFGIVPSNLEGAIVSSHYFLFEIDKSKLLPPFLAIFIKLNAFMNQIKATGSTNYAAIRPKQVLEYLIPLPSLSEQQQIVNAYEEKMAKVEEMEQEAGSLVQSIDRCILNDLGIQIQSKKRNKGIQFIPFQDFDKWGVEFNFGYGKSEGVLKSPIFPNQRLPTLVYINPPTLLLTKNQEVSFLPMACISDEYGEIIEHKIGTPEKSQGYTKFKEGDLLWAKITPCMENGKSAIACNLINGFGYGSTEYHVLRQKREDFLIEYLHLLLRLKILRENAVSFFTGSSGQQRVPKSYLEELVVPVPPISLQTALVEFVGSTTQKIKQLKTDAEMNRESALQTFSQSIFH